MSIRYLFIYFSRFCPLRNFRESPPVPLHYHYERYLLFSNDIIRTVALLLRARAVRSTTTWRQTKRRIVAQENKIHTHTHGQFSYAHTRLVYNTMYFIRTYRVVIIEKKKYKKFVHIVVGRVISHRVILFARTVLCRLPCGCRWRRRDGVWSGGVAPPFWLLNADESEYHLRLGLETASNDFAEFPAEKKKR